MPIFNLNNKNLYFSHIPKCGGSSIEELFKNIPGSRVAFLDVNFNKKFSWSVSSPQHIKGNDVSKLFPISFFDEFFTVARNPFDRFCSAFVFQKYFSKKIAKEVDINQFASSLDENGVLLPGQFDNHFSPQITFLYPGASYRVFKFENGLDSVRKYLSRFFCIDLGNASVPHLLKKPEHIGINSDSLNDHSRKKIMDIYKSDFEIFNY